MPVGDGAIGVAYAAGSLWVATHLTGELVRVDPETREVMARIEVGDRA